MPYYDKDKVLKKETKTLMKKLHHLLRQKYQWYDKWHKHPKHNLFHWLGLIACSELAFLFALTTFAYVNDLVPENRASARLCIRQMPIVNVYGPASATGIETPDTFTFTITNTNTSQCPDDTFITRISVLDSANISISPKNFIHTLKSRPLFSIDSKDNAPSSVSDTFTVTPHTGIIIGNKTIIVTVQNSAKEKFTTEGSFIYNISGADQSVCNRARPGVSVTDAYKRGMGGTAIPYEITVTNNDVSCGGSIFKVDVVPESLPPGGSWISTPGMVSLESGRALSTTITVTSPTVALPKDYPFSIVAINQTSAPNKPNKTSAPVSATYALLPGLNENPEPTIFLISPAPAIGQTGPFEFFGDHLMVIAQTSGAYRVAYMVIKVDGIGGGTSCLNTSQCSANIDAGAWALNSVHDITVKALKSDGTQAAYPLRFTAMRAANPQLGTSTITLTADSATVTAENPRTTLRWIVSPRAIECHTSDNWKNPEIPPDPSAGSRITPPITQTTTFTLFCTSQNGADVRKDITIYPQGAPPPPPPPPLPGPVQISCDSAAVSGDLTDIVCQQGADNTILHVGASTPILKPDKIVIRVNGLISNQCDYPNANSCEVDHLFPAGQTSASVYIRVSKNGYIRGEYSTTARR